MTSFHEKFTALTSGVERRYQSRLKDMERALKLGGVKMPRRGNLSDDIRDEASARPTYKPDTRADTYRKFSPITRNMAGKILQLGPTVNPQIYQTALIAANGTNDPKVKEADLIDSMRGYFDIHMSHSQEIGKYERVARGGMRGVERLFQLGDTVGRGGMMATLQQARGLADGAEWLEKVITSQAGQKVAAKLGELYFKGGVDSAAAGVTRVFELGRSLRLGGAVVSVAKLGLDAAVEQAKQQKEGAYLAAGSRAAGIAFGDPDYLAGNWREDSHLQSRGRGVFRRIRDAFGFTGASAREASELYAQKLGLLKMLGNDPALLGGTEAGVLAEYSRQTGVPVSRMSPLEKRRALTEMAKVQLEEFIDDPQNVKEMLFNHPELEDWYIAKAIMTRKEIDAQRQIALRDTAEKRLTGRDQYAGQSPDELRAQSEINYSQHLMRKGPDFRDALERNRIDVEMSNKAMTQRRQVQAYD